MRTGLSPILVRFPERKNNILVLAHHIGSGVIHKLQRALVIWLHETMPIGESDSNMRVGRVLSDSDSDR
jgi:hypothetical protein